MAASDVVPGRDDPAGNAYEFSVGELSFALKRTVEDAFGRVRVRGEISGLKRAASGHVYLSLKDEDAVLDGVIWRSAAGKLKFKPEDGLEVICTGKVTTYPGRSKYQIVIDRLEPAGAGALMALLEERKKKLAAEGLFNPAHKKDLPYLPETIGVITSPTGAVIRDILHRLEDRFPRHVLMWPVLVQGDGAAEQIADAINGFNKMKPSDQIPRPDLLIVARGGGSIEDLWSFNEENVVRAAFNSEIPLISAVGHETDTTLIDFVSDKRAPTPTAAAEMAVPVKAELVATVLDLAQRQVRAQSRIFGDSEHKLTSLARALPKLTDLLAMPSQKFDSIADRLRRSLSENVSKHRLRYSGVAARLRRGLVSDGVGRGLERIGELEKRLETAISLRQKERQDRLENLWKLIRSLSYEDVLARGFAVVRTADGQLVKSGQELASGDQVEIEFGRDDRLPARIDGGTSRQPKKKAAKKPAPQKQGDLF